MDNLKRISRMLGLHPIVGAGMIALDWMLFGGEAGSLGASAPITIVVGLLFILPCVLIQKYAYGDDWMSAVGKGTLVGIITGIPTALPSIGTGLLTALGLPELFSKDKEGGEMEGDLEEKEVESSDEHPSASN